MKYLVFPPPPEGCPVVLEQSGGEVKLVFPPRRWSEFKVEWIITVILLGFCLGFWLTGDWGFIFYGSWFGIWCPGLALLTANRASTWTTLTVANDHLFISVVHWFGTKRWEWSRLEIRSIAVLRGLRITGTEVNVYLFTDRQADDVAWVADVLCLALRFDGDYAPQPDGIEVHFRRQGEEEPYRGYLRTETGKLALRHSGLPREFAFRIAPQFGASELGQYLLTNLIFLDPGDVHCRPDETGGACLQLVKESIKLHLLIWCSDKDALQDALARFLGSKDD